MTHPDLNTLKPFIDMALREDIGKGDITSQLLIHEKIEAQMLFVAREELVVCGTFIPAMVYEQLSPAIKVVISATEGNRVKKGTVIAKVVGPARAILTGERVALNFMQRLSGVATLTAQYVEAVKGTKTVILDTRKTMPGLRLLDKYAVKTGGAQNHRMRLDDMVLIKDNHVALCGSIVGAVSKAQAGTSLMVEVECDNINQLEEALEAGPDRILLDNMDLDTLRKAVKLVGGRIPLEISGGVSIENVRAVAETGVDYISVGRLTHSARAADIGADITVLTP